MQQVRVFDIGEQEKCNEFLATHKPSQVDHHKGGLFSKGRIIVFYDDGSYPVSYQISDLKEHLQSVQAARFQQEVALHVAKAELAGLNPMHNKGKHEELSAAIRNIENAIDVQDTKEDFVRGRIEELQKN